MVGALLVGLSHAQSPVVGDYLNMSFTGDGETPTAMERLSEQALRTAKPLAIGVQMDPYQPPGMEGGAGGLGGAGGGGIRLNLGDVGAALMRAVQANAGSAARIQPGTWIAPTPVGVGAGPAGGNFVAGSGSTVAPNGSLTLPEPSASSGVKDVPGSTPGFKGEAGSTARGQTQSRSYGDDGYPKTDRELGHPDEKGVGCGDTAMIGDDRKVAARRRTGTGDRRAPRLQAIHHLRVERRWH